VVAAGEALVSPSVTRRLIAEFAPRFPAPRPAVRLDELNNREREVMTAIGSGLSNRAGP
jgi:DNA-binding NarL/FixJ family response regulator